MVEGYVYFLAAPSVGLVKIGRSIDIERRLQEIRLISPIALELIGYIDGGAAMETRYHQRWSHLRQHGEWFRADPELMSELCRAALMNAWNRAGPDARAQFLADIDTPVFDRTRSA